MTVKKIYIEGLGLVEGHFSGVGQYILGILRGLDQVIDEAKYAGEAVPKVRVLIPYNNVGQFKSFNFKHIGYKRLPLSFKVMSALWYRGKLPPIDLWCGRGAYIFTRFVRMPLLFNQSATVIYDLSFELHRQHSEERNARFLSKRTSATIKDNKKIITISRNARQEIINFYGLKPNKVVVATPATDPSMFYRRSDKEINAVKQKYSIAGDYILALSNLEPRKNLSALVKAYCQLPKEVVDKTALLLVGVSGWKTEKLFKEIVEKVESGYNIIRPSTFVDDQDKPAVISGAKMLVYPSHYEGFGMPPLEALACGVPVICANNSSLPEVVGNTARMIKSDDQAELVEAIKDYLGQNNTLRKKTLTEGPDRASHFSWIESAKVFLQVAEELNS